MKVKETLEDRIATGQNRGYERPDKWGVTPYLWFTSIKVLRAGRVNDRFNAENGVDRRDRG